MFCADQTYVTQPEKVLGFRWAENEQQDTLQVLVKWQGFPSYWEDLGDMCENFPDFDWLGEAWSEKWENVTASTVTPDQITSKGSRKQPRRSTRARRAVNRE